MCGRLRWNFRGLGGIDLTRILPPGCDQVGLDQDSSVNIDGLISS